MPYGEIFAGTFQQIWRHKKLWGFGLLGALLGSIGLGLYQAMTLRWQSQWYGMLGAPESWGATPPPGFMSDLMSGLTWMWVGLGLLVVLGLLGYVVNLVMRGAIIGEATVAWQGGRTVTGRGFKTGARRAVYLFLIDLLWTLPGLLLVCGGSVGFFGFVAAADAWTRSGDRGGGIALLFFGLLCSVLCLALLTAAVTGVFAPLMYQAAVAGRRGAGAAVREGWRLARANLGPMIIFLLLLMALSLLLNLVMQAVTLPFSLPWLSSWLRDWTGLMEDMARGQAVDFPAMSGVWFTLSLIVSALLMLLTTSFVSTFGLTLYTEVYRRLAGLPVPAPEVVEPPPPASAETAAPIAQPQIIVPDEPIGPAGEEPNPYV